MRSAEDWPNLPLAAVFISPVSRAMETLDSIKQLWETPAIGRNDIKGARDQTKASLRLCPRFYLGI